MKYSKEEINQERVNRVLDYIGMAKAEWEYRTSAGPKQIAGTPPKISLSSIKEREWLLNEENIVYYLDHKSDT